MTERKDRLALHHVDATVVRDRRDAEPGEGGRQPPARAQYHLARAWIEAGGELSQQIEPDRRARLALEQRETRRHVAERVRAEYDAGGHRVDITHVRVA